MEDILEELVGEIWDDTDVIVNDCIATGENFFGQRLILMIGAAVRELDRRDIDSCR